MCTKSGVLAIRKYIDRYWPFYVDASAFYFSPWGAIICYRVYYLYPYWSGQRGRVCFRVGESVHAYLSMISRSL